MTHLMGADRLFRSGRSRSAMPLFGRMAHRASGLTQPESRYAPPEAGLCGPQASLRLACGAPAPRREPCLACGPHNPVR